VQSSTQRLTALGEGEKVTTLLQIEDAMRNHTYIDDPHTVASLFRRIHSIDPGEAYTTVDEASRALAQQHITAQTYRNVVSDLDEREKNILGRKGRMTASFGFFAGAFDDAACRVGQLGWGDVEVFYLHDAASVYLI